VVNAQKRATDHSKRKTKERTGGEFRQLLAMNLAKP